MTMTQTHRQKSLHLFSNAALLFLLLALLPGKLFSQGQDNWWFFGNSAGVSFQTGSPVSVPGGQINTVEGCATISSNTGVLNFYTEGQRVWNRNHVQMPNGFGLMGNTSTTQSGVIVKKPGSPNIYYIFTADAAAGPNGLRWSEVDMNLAAGLGDVTANKNILLYAPTAEKICAVSHCNNTDVWVVSHALNSNQFKAYLVTATGISAAPVNSNAGTVYSTNSAHVIGCMKLSGDGRKLACAIRYTTTGGQPGYCELFDFDNSTGMVSGGLVLPTISYAYGIEFSPDSKLMYANKSQSGAVIQWNMCAGSNAAILASQTQVGTSASGWLGTMQLGPDNKIYMARYSTGWLGVINNPNVIGLGCNYWDNGVPITFGTSTFGLSNFVTRYNRPPPVINNQIDTTVNCLLDSLSFVSSSITQVGCTPMVSTVVSVAWNFGDVASGPNNTSTLMTPVHLFSAPGNYILTLIVNYNCYSDTVIDTLTVSSCGPIVTVPSDTICYGACTSLTATGTGGSPPYTFTWTPNIGSGPGPHQVCPTSTTVYSVLITDASNDTSSTTATVLVNPLPVLAMSSTSVLCNGGNTGAAIVSAAGISPFTYSWNTNPVQITDTASNLSAGNYVVVVTDTNGCMQTDSVIVTEPLALSTTNSTVSSICTACNGSITTTPAGGTPPYSYAWSTAPVQITQTATGLCAGTYTVTITDANNCTLSSSVVLSDTQITVPVSVVSQTDLLCFGDCNGNIDVNPTAGTAPYIYSWNTSPIQVTQMATALCAGTYSVSVTDANGCTGSASATLTEPSQLTSTVSANTAICYGQSTTLTSSGSGGTPAYSFAWTPGNTSGSSATVNPTTTTIYTVNVTDANGCTTTAQNVTVTVNPLPVVQFTQDVTDGCAPVCVNFTTQTLNATSSIWNFGDGATSQTLNPLHCFVQPGVYDVTLYVTDNNGCKDSLTTNNLINVYPWAVADFYPSPQPTDVNNGTIFFSDQSTGATNWYWTFGDADSSTSTSQNPSFKYEQHGSYIVTQIATNQWGCSDTAVRIIIIEEPFSIYVPTAFTPNGDNKNEIFLAQGVGIDPGRFEMIIYDRWGIEVFRSKDMAFGWDGRGKSGRDILPEGVYVWLIITHANVDGAIHRYYGKVTLIK